MNKSAIRFLYFADFLRFQKFKAERVVVAKIRFQATGKAHFGGVIEGWIRVVSYHCIPFAVRRLPKTATRIVVRGIRM